MESTFAEEVVEEKTYKFLKKTSCIKFWALRAEYAKLSHSFIETLDKTAIHLPGKGTHLTVVYE